MLLSSPWLLYIIIEILFLFIPFTYFTPSCTGIFSMTTPPAAASQNISMEITLERYSAILWVPEWWTNFFPNMTSYHYTAVRNLNINQEKNYYVSQEFQSSTDFLLIFASVQYNKEIWSVSNFCRRNKVRLGAIGFSLHSGIPYFHQHVPRY